MQSLLDRRLPLRTRRSLLAADVRRKVARTELYRVPYGPGSVYLSDADFAIDRRSFDFAVTEESYAGDYDGAVVLDLGAHKGYYGAYVVAHGARAVVAYEPEAANHDVLRRTAATYDDAAWTLVPAAVDAEGGRSELHVMGASWGHALAPPESFAEYEVGLQNVEVVALADALAAAARLDGSRLVVKLNIEGAECTAILGTPVEAWRDADEVFVEIHPWAACGASELAARLQAGGLTRAPSAHPAVLHMRRAATARSDRRSEPT